MTPLPWSFSSLEDFINCPKAFHEKRILKSVPPESSPEMDWGNYAHKAFESRQASSTQLPPDLTIHEPYMQRIEAWPGNFWTEQKVALNRKLMPCTFFSPDVWWRGVIDYKKVHETLAKAVDYKTGKPHEKWKQLASFALHTFATHPVELVDAQFYWTKTQTITRKVYARAEIPQLWAQFVPDLKQYATAFKDDVWQARPSGLCHGWCPVTKCEHWRPKKVRR